mmetsp:Transcript_11223/g.17744  ORF Transcript_11223/g.17744 Transcript_11223/m.17744 type:complete len:299 (-) Transcript_11223:159-1055(-)
MSLVQRKSSFCAKNLHKDTPEFDLLLNVGGTVIKTYRILLTVACPYFATLINDASGDDVDKLELLDGKNGSAKGAILANDASGDVAKLEILDFKEGEDSVRGKAGCVRVGHLGSMEIFMEKEEKIGEIVVTGRSWRSFLECLHPFKTPLGVMTKLGTSDLEEVFAIAFKYGSEKLIKAWEVPLISAGGLNNKSTKFLVMASHHGMHDYVNLRIAQLLKRLEVIEYGSFNSRMIRSNQNNNFKKLMRLVFQLSPAGIKQALGLVFMKLYVVTGTPSSAGLCDTESGETVRNWISNMIRQ